MDLATQALSKAGLSGTKQLELQINKLDQEVRRLKTKIRDIQRASNSLRGKTGSDQLEISAEYPKLASLEDVEDQLNRSRIKRDLNLRKLEQLRLAVRNGKQPLTYNEVVEIIPQSYGFTGYIFPADCLFYACATAAGHYLVFKVE